MLPYLQAATGSLDYPEAMLGRPQGLLSTFARRSGARLGCSRPTSSSSVAPRYSFGAYATASRFQSTSRQFAEAQLMHAKQVSRAGSGGPAFQMLQGRATAIAPSPQDEKNYLHLQHRPSFFKALRGLMASSANLVAQTWPTFMRNCTYAARCFVHFALATGQAPEQYDPFCHLQRQSGDLATK